MNNFQEQEIEVTNEIRKLITCSLCTGYFIDATTIKECLHHCKFLNILFQIYGYLILMY